MTENTINEVSLADIFTDIIIKQKNQNVICLFEGKPGMGKSNATLVSACWCSIKLAAHFGGDPAKYFNIGHLATISQDQVMRVLNIMRLPKSQHGIFIFDDFGVAYDNRDWRSTSNKAMNDVLQTMRTDNNIIFMSVPDSDWIDVKGRNIIGFKIVMDKPIFNKELENMGKSRAVGRLSRVTKAYNTQSRRNFYPYFKRKGAIYNKIAFGKCPDELEALYEKIRAIELRRVKNKNVESLMDGMIEKTMKSCLPSPKNLHGLPVKDRCKEIYRDIQAGVYEDMTEKEICKINGIKYNTWAHNKQSIKDTFH